MIRQLLLHSRCWVASAAWEWPVLTLCKRRPALIQAVGCTVVLCQAVGRTEEHPTTCSTMP